MLEGTTYAYSIADGLCEVFPLWIVTLNLMKLPGREDIQAPCPTCGYSCKCLDLEWFNNKTSDPHQAFWR